MKKPDLAEIPDHKIKSVDEELYDIAYMKKDPINQKFLNKCKEYSIENYKCCCLTSSFKYLQITPSLLKSAKGNNKSISSVSSNFITKGSTYSSYEEFVTGKKSKVKKDMSGYEYLFKK